MKPEIMIALRRVTKTSLRRFMTLLNLANEYRDLGSLTLSLIDYYKLRHHLISEENKLISFRLPNGLTALCPLLPNYLKTLSVTFDEIFIWRVYDRVKDFKPSEEDFVLDLGAFIGLYTLKNYKAKYIVAIEPHPLSYTILVKNIKFNNLNNVLPLNVAIWDKEGFVTFYEGIDLVGSSSLKPLWRLGKHGKQFIVKTVTLNEVFKASHVKYFDVAKIDIEGAELELVRGGKDVLGKGLIQRIIMEVHKKVIPQKTFYQVLRELGFRLIYRLSL
ncbi:MAG: FkbM family methyltransferase [Infirmifilum sp.]